MDYFGATSKLFSVYEKLKTMNIPNNELGLFEHRYKVDGNLAFLVAVVTKPIKEKTGKKKVFDKVINKSKDKKRPILPKYFKYIRLYLSGIFSQISSGRDEVLQRIKKILTGFRLRFYLKNNLKYVFLDNKNPEILINQGTSSRGQYYCFIHIFRL